MTDQAGQIKLFRFRTIALRDTLVMAQSALEHAFLSIVVEGTKRSTIRAIHQIKRTIEDDDRRYSSLDNR